MTEDGIVNIRGKEYKTVARRVADFRFEYPISDGWGLDTEIVTDTENRVVVRAFVTGPDGAVLGTGLAEEFRGASKINQTSAMECCETSAIGRALSACGYGGLEYASANEVESAIDQQTKPPQKQPPPVFTGDNDELDRQIIDNCERGASLSEKYQAWHEATLKNYFSGAEKVADLKERTDKVMFLTKQKEWIKMREEENG